MKVFVYENPNEINSWFGKPDHEIPFLGTNLLNFNSMGFLQASSSVKDTLKIFLPQSWDIPSSQYFEHYDGSVGGTLKTQQEQEYELVLITNMFSVLVGELSNTDFSHLKQNPGKFFRNRGVVGGYLKAGQELPVPEDFPGFVCFVELYPESYLKINQALLENVSVDSKQTQAKVYGSPSILAENISSEATICAPSFIGKDVVIFGKTYIGPGSVIRGNSIIESSRIFGSYIENSRVENTSLEDSILSDSSISGLSLDGSVIPSGSLIRDTRKI